MDLYNLVVSAKLSKGGGGDEPVLIDKTISANGTYKASSDNADGYKKVVANVPNSYAAADEGKVVSNGALASQTSVTKTANGTYDTTENNQVVVNVPGPSGTVNITQNGTVDVAQYASANVNVSGGGGGASNVVQGTFTTSSTTGAASTLTIPYTGNGYPIYFALWIDGGMYNNTSGGNTDWYNLIQVYAIGFFSISKSRMTTAPTYSGDVEDNYGTVALIYKVSATSPTSYSKYSSVTASSYSNSDASSSSATSVRFKDNGTTLSYFVASTSYGLVANTKYAYIAVYSE